uniref:Uncharacterized protein n=1 Tax=Caenorhabditis japonica TaxID=281687 RepID=A0A8R1I2G5_CAEJA
MLTRVPVLIFVAVIVLALCQEPGKPELEKRPALLSRYGRAMLPRYGKRSDPSSSSSSTESMSTVQIGDEFQEIVCQLLDGKYMCLPANSDNLRQFFV